MAAKKSAEDAVTQEAATTKPTIESVLSAIDAPVRDMLLEKLGEHVKVVREQNSRIAKIRQSEKNDPNNTEFLDSVWRDVVANGGDDELNEIEGQWQAIVAEHERLLSLLREGAKKHIQEPLSEREVQELRKTVNEGKDLIVKSRASAETVAEMADKMLEMVGEKFEGGVASLLPQVDSLLNQRGRKAGTSTGEGYGPRMLDISINGETTNKTVKKSGGEESSKANFAFAAEDLSKRFGAGTIPGNKVTPLELEEAYYASKGVEFRKKDDMPETHEFEFEKVIKVQNANDDSFREEPHTVKIKVTRWTKEAASA